MKKTIRLVAMLVLIGFQAGAQNNKRTSAFNYLKDYDKNFDVASLNKAKENIDAALEHADTKDDAKTWVYAGLIYQKLFENNLRKLNEQLLKEIPEEEKRLFAAYERISGAELEKACSSYIKARELDTKKAYTKELTNLDLCWRHFENMGRAQAGADKFAESLVQFEKAIEINNALGNTDTININNAAIVAEKAGNFEKAKQHYQKLIDLKYGKGNTYSLLSNVHLNAQDTAAALDVIRKGRSVYPDDLNLIIAETNYHLRKNNNQEAIKGLELAVQKTPDRADIYLVLGSTYDNMANPRNTEGKDMDKPKNYEELVAKAEAAYKKSIELKPDYFDALFNLGALYNNVGVFISKKADAITDKAKYEKESARATAEFSKAIPYLEKALELNPNDRGTMFALKQIYIRTEQQDKVAKMNEMLKNNK